MLIKQLVVNFGNPGLGVENSREIEWYSYVDVGRCGCIKADIFKE